MFYSRILLSLLIVLPIYLALIIYLPETVIRTTLFIISLLFSFEWADKKMNSVKDQEWIGLNSRLIRTFMNKKMSKKDWGFIMFSIIVFPIFLGILISNKRYKEADIFISTSIFVMIALWCIELVFRFIII